LKIALSNQSKSSERVNLYAEAGMWYDALSEALASTNNSQQAKVAASLLEDLAKSEQPLLDKDLSNIALTDQ
jgi:hypothetical protein